MQLSRQNFKIRPEHLARKAIVYLRQSSQKQVRENRESQALQYSMEERAKELGWTRVEVIDVDLGKSAGIGAPEREGFQRIISAVACGEVGLVISREVSRLSRTDKDWCQLLEICQLFDTLISDESQIYDLNEIDDQLVLGIKGTLSAVELKILRMRLQDAHEAKARRGEMFKRLPVGYVLDVDGHVTLDPNERIRQAIGAIFEKFKELWSIRQTFMWFRNHDVELPTNSQHGNKLCWKIPTLGFVNGVLKNPFYAGAYVWGRRPMETIIVDGKPKRRQQRCLPPEKCRVFIPEHHVGYIDWGTFEYNQRLISRNAINMEENELMSAIRAGKGLLGGLLRCGRCGRKLQVRYWGGKGTSARYLCVGDFLDGGDYCVGFGGASVDRRINEEVLKVLSPLGVRASLRALEELNSEQSQELTLLQGNLKQMEYEAQRAFEQYDQVDPRNRLVANELERRWNVKLENHEHLQARIANLCRQNQTLTSDQETQIGMLGEHFEQVWNGAHMTAQVKKKILRTVFEEIIVHSLDDTNELRFILHWKGGVHTELVMKRALSATAQRTSEEAVDIIRKMAVRYGDGQIASVLNRLGHRTGKGLRWNHTRVQTARRKHSIAGQKQKKEVPGILSLNQAAVHCGVSHRTIERLAEAGILKREQVTPRAPWEIRREDIDAEPVRGIIEHLLRTGKLVLEVGTSDSQKSLFEKF